MIQDIYPGYELFLNPRSESDQDLWVTKSTGSWIRISKTVFSTYVYVKLGTRYLVGRYPVATEDLLFLTSKQDEIFWVATFCMQK
jgi:hypothetical protein